MEMKNFIQKYNDIIDHELCDQIIKEADENHFKSATTGDGNVSDYRNCIAKPLSDKFDKSIFEVVAKSLRKYCETFKWCEFGLNIEDTGYQHLFYKGSNRGEYKMHTDHFDLHPRVLSCSMILNDNYDGGDFEIAIGNWFHHATGYGFHGSIKNVRFFRKNLSSSEVSTLYAKDL